MKKEKKKISAALKDAIIFEALINNMGMVEVCKHFNVKPKIVMKWRKKIIKRCKQLFYR